MEGCLNTVGKVFSQQKRLSCVLKTKYLNSLGVAIVIFFFFYLSYPSGNKYQSLCHHLVSVALNSSVFNNLLSAFVALLRCVRPPGVLTYPSRETTALTLRLAALKRAHRLGISKHPALQPSCEGLSCFTSCLLAAPIAWLRAQSSSPCSGPLRGASSVVCVCLHRRQGWLPQLRRKVGAPNQVVFCCLTEKLCEQLSEGRFFCLFFFKFILKKPVSCFRLG